MHGVIPRAAEWHLRAVARRYPVVVVLGPRQSGKTTLCRSVFAALPYATLEDPDTRAFASVDPRGFLAQFPGGAVLDEIQRAPELPSYLQAIVDARRKRPYFVLTGSENLTLTQGVSQSLAGRAALITLLPLCFGESRAFPRAPKDLFDVMFAGGYPAIFDRRVPPSEWLANYVRTYVERDARQLLNVTDLSTFQTFLGLCAGHAGQLVNLSALGTAAGITHNTAKAWLSVLEASYLVRRLSPWFVNVNKRLVKAPKLHFFDSGLLCYLLGIRSARELRTHASRGAVFESWVVSEIHKTALNRGEDPRLWFYRDHGGTEVDLLVEAGKKLLAIEIKSGQTIADDFFVNLERFSALVPNASVERLLVYGGDASQARTRARVIAWSDVGRFDRASAPKKSGRRSVPGGVPSR